MTYSANQSRLPINIGEAITAYLTHLGGNSPVSIAGATKDIRFRFSDIEMMDSDLADEIAGRAIRIGLNIDFDGAGPTRLHEGSTSPSPTLPHRHAFAVGEFRTAETIA